MDVRSYTSDLNDAEWALLEPLVSRSHPAGQRQTCPPRRIIDAIFYLLRTGGCSVDTKNSLVLSHSSSAVVFRRTLRAKQSQVRKVQRPVSYPSRELLTRICDEVRGVIH